MKEIYLHIPKPCHEQFSKFKPTPQGGFCASCQKEVIDFTDWDEERIKAYLLRKPTGCGRFRSRQLKAYPYASNKGKPVARWITASLMASLSFLVTKPALAQKRQQPTEQRVPDAKGAVAVEQVARSQTVTGQVKDVEGNLVPGANVVQKGTTNGTVTDAEGRFALDMTAFGSKILVFSFIGLETVEYEVVPKDEPVEIVMALDTIQLGGMVVGGYQRRKISPRRWWWRLRRLFGER